MFTNTEASDPANWNETYLHGKISSTYMAQNAGEIKEENTYISASFENSTYVSAAFENSTYVSATFENSTYVSATFEDNTYVSATFEDSTYVSATFEDSTYVSGAFEPSENTTYSISLPTYGDVYTIDSEHDYPDYKDYFDEDYFKDVENEVANLTNSTYAFNVYHFERLVYLYVWPILVIVTSLANILVVTVLLRKKMRTATNIILVAIAISDSLTGLVTLPVIFPAYGSYASGSLTFTKASCETFMVVKYFISRAFHTISIWLTVILGMQRFVSVRFPFRVNTFFSMSRTTIAIISVALLSPFLHLFHAFDSKTDDMNNCVWDVKVETCGKGCIYLWLTLFLMHFLPCVFLIIFCWSMIRTMQSTTRKLSKSHMVSNPENIDRRSKESRRISAIVFVVLVVFLIPEVPYTVFLSTFLIKHHGNTQMPFKTNRIVACAYEVCVVLSFHANFWTYLVMNRKFRQGLREMLIDPMFEILAKFGFNHVQSRSRRMSISTSIRTVPSDIWIPNSHDRLTRRNSCLPQTNGGQLERKQSKSSSSSSRRSSVNVEMRTYSFKPRNNSVE
ncbi:sex peptide receptor-related protein 2-like [Dreissena polymorpha]|uniref:G-protein coupled receptors family 1 profile domain-containing protein n=1 Tax=Dreissena polymorpha TaxID=45954 RepID=A0A9D4GN88_DREPO|nr:sex peptide receptor-related protein 2-like [Dreissena polymorpha]XP_052211947.1 sex peptide receptor-related protein 2-like [Dreissena polymorpha]KAH3818501.1 hypothetical protein DPMN_120222 [Dreissena polymorpha]